MTTELARIETITPAELFKPGTLDPILERIRAEVRREAACLDISTEANRKAIASLAYKVKKSKTERQEQAVAAERQRAEDARKAEEAAAEKREANKRHRAKINREVRDALRRQVTGSNLTLAQCQMIVTAIASDLIPHTKISY